jgi:hypothetical protein
LIETVGVGEAGDDMIGVDLAGAGVDPAVAGMIGVDWAGADSVDPAIAEMVGVDLAGAGSADEQADIDKARINAKAKPIVRGDDISM